MKRREFLFGGVGAACWAGSAAAQSKIPTVGLLVTGNRDPYHLFKVFKEELARLGYAEGTGIQFEIRSADGRTDALPRLAAELVERRVDIIVAWLTPAVLAAKAATTQIPIVMAGAGDPVATGIVASLSRPGGNVTGMAGATADLAGKNIELIRELLPSARRLVGLFNPNDSFTKPFLEQAQHASSITGFALTPIMVGSPSELDSVFERIRREGTDAILLQPSLPTRRVAELGLAARIPVVSPIDGFASEGGLLGYSGRVADGFLRSAAYVDKILKGARPSDLPVQLPTQFELKINLKVAKALGLNVPPAMLARADEVID